MKATKIVGIIFVVFGILFAILGTVAGIVRLIEKDDCKYATAQIIKIDEKKTGDPEFPIEHTTYVALDINGNQITAKLNTYNSSFYIGKEIDVYYFEYDLQTVYENGSEVFFLIYALGGIVFAAIGSLLIIKSKRSIQE
ncbi:MAG: hypothetical protein IJD35_05280 [Clostridia bacterium]|nr:hypothetical protein [Clostridia bacterium]